MNDVSRTPSEVLQDRRQLRAQYEPEARTILRPSRFIYCFFAICFVALVAATAPRSGNETSCVNPDWFAVRQKFLEGEQLTALCKGELDAAEGNVRAAENELGVIIHRTPGSEDAYHARSTLSHLYFRLGRFHEAEAQVGAMGAMKPGAADLRNVRPLYELLARSPDLAIGYSQPSTIESKMFDGNLFAPVVVNGTAAVYMVDSGMNLSMMSESEAARLHLTPQSIETRMSDISGKVSAPIRVVVVDELTVGATHLRHVPFLVVLDTNGAFEGVPEGERGVLGIQPLIALGSLGFELGGKLRVGGKTKTSMAEAPLLFDGAMPLAQIVYQGKPITVTFDSGATQTTFNPPFVNLFPDILRAGTNITHAMNGISGTTEQRASNIPQLVFAFGREVRLSPATILLDETSASSAWAAANLGYDSMQQAVPFTIDFRQMKVVFDAHQ